MCGFDYSPGDCSMHKDRCSTSHSEKAWSDMEEPSRIDQRPTEGLVDPAGDVLWLLGLVGVIGALENL